MATEQGGIGIYTQGLGGLPAPKQAARLAADNGVSFVAMYAVQQDHNGTKRINSADDIKRYAEAFATAGVTPWIWGYPKAGLEPKFVELMKAATSGTIRGWILDPELPYKWKGGGTAAGQKEADPNAPPPAGSKPAMRAAAMDLISQSLDAMTEKHELAVTSYGMADYHKNFPWAEFVAGWGSPQLYDVTPAEIDKGIASWRAMGWSHIVPSVPAFGRKSGAQLNDFLSCFVDGTENISGFIFWSWRQVAPDEWRVLKRWSEWFKKGVVT